MEHGIAKKITAYLSLLVITLPVICLLFLQLQQVYVRYKMQEKLEFSLLRTISIDEKNIQWIKPGKEIFIGDSLFDVKHHKIENGKVLLTGLYDHEETFIENHLRNLGAQSHSEGKSLVLMKLLHLLQNIFFSQIKFTDFFLIFTNPYCEYFYIPVLTPFKTILTPPPQQ
jgi:hypothetical protein